MTTVTTSPRPPALLSPAFFADPYPTYHSLRAADPVMWDETLHSWVLSGYAEVAASLNDGRLARGRTEEEQAVILDQLDASGQGELRPLRKLLWRMMLFSDPPAHTRLRALANRAFTPSAIERLRPRIQRLVDSALDAVRRAVFGRCTTGCSRPERAGRPVSATRSVGARSSGMRPAIAAWYASTVARA